MEFYKKGKAGCMFVAIAAKEPQKYEWQQTVIPSISTTEIDKAIQDALQNHKVSTLSLIFPTVNDIDSLLFLLNELENCESIVTEKQPHENYLCYGFRVKVKEKLSWVTGFGPFDFFPKTRKTPFSEITFRIKDRPDYEWVMKESPKNILHLTDMNMKDIPKEQFSNLWSASLTNTEKILGHKPNFISAAKMSFSIPINFIDNEN